MSKNGFPTSRKDYPMNKPLHSPSLANLFPDDAEGQEFVNNLAMTSRLDQALHKNGGHPVLSELIRAKASQQRLLEEVHDLAERDAKWAESSKSLREMFPRQA